MYGNEVVNFYMVWSVKTIEVFVRFLQPLAGMAPPVKKRKAYYFFISFFLLEASFMASPRDAFLSFLFISL